MLVRPLLLFSQRLIQPYLLEKLTRNQTSLPSKSSCPKYKQGAIDANTVSLLSVISGIFDLPQGHSWIKIYTSHLPQQPLISDARDSETKCTSVGICFTYTSPVVVFNWVNSALFYHQASLFLYYILPKVLKDSHILLSV